MGQDWFDLVVLAPFLASAGAGALRRSRLALLLYGGGLVYTSYTFVIYTFAVHFNSLFLVYCAALGLSLASLASLVAAALREDVRTWYREPPVKLAGGLQIALAVVFAALWLSEIVPALARGGVPASVAEGGFTTNPVHVLDLSILLPALAVSGVATLRRRPLGYFLGPILLTFGILMAITIGLLVVVMRRRGLGGDLTVPVIFGAVALVSATVLARFLRGLEARR